MLTGNMLESNNYLIRGIQVSQKERIKFREGTIHQNLGLNNIFLKNYKQARREFDEAISDYENVIQLESDENIKKYAKMRIGFLYSFISLLKYYVGNYRSSLKYAIKASQTNRDEKRGLIWGKWLIGASHIAMGDAKSAETPLYFAITECRKINLVELEAAILLQLAKLNHLRGNDYEALKVITEALEIASRCSYVLQQADIHLFLSKYYRDTGDLDKAREHAGLAKLRSHQMIDVETGDYVTKDEGTKWKYKPCYDKAVKLLEELGKMENV